MKEVIEAFARYNQAANAALAATLRGADPALLAEDQGAYYKSVLGTLEHLALSEAAWPKRYADFIRAAYPTDHPLLEADVEALKARLGTGLEGTLALLAEADAFFLDFARGADPVRLGERLRFKTYKGVEMERTFWNLPFHILNHGTHHRGEISALLDRKGVKNDFAGFNAYMA